MKLSVAPEVWMPLHGKRLVLELVSPEHADFLSLCYTNDAFMNVYRLSQTRDVRSQFLREGLAKQKHQLLIQERGIEWVIRRRLIDGTDAFLGLAALADYNEQHNRAEFLIGFLHPEMARAGLGLEASLLVLEFAFQSARLHKLISYVYAFNQSAQGNILHLGFSQEAFFREHYFNPHKKEFIDIYQNGMLARDFFSSLSLKRWSKRLLDRDITAEEDFSHKDGSIMSKKVLNAALDSLLKLQNP